MVCPPTSFLRLPLNPGWDDTGSGVLTKPTYDHTTFEFTGAAYRADGSLIISSLRPARIGHWRPVDPVSLPGSTLAAGPEFETAIFAGHYFNIWGHVLFETLSTAVVARHMPVAPVIFAPFAPGDDYNEFLSSWERTKPLLAAAGWDDRPLLIQEGQIRARRLIVPQRMSAYASPAGHPLLHPQIAIVYDRIRATIAPDVSPSRLMVARRPWWSVRLHPSEERFYEIMSERGATVVNGVDVAPVEQARLFASASAVIGFAGSNLHNSIFAHRGVNVFEIGDHRSYQSGGPDLRNMTQVGMCDVLEQTLTFVHTYNRQSGGGLEPLSAESIADDIFHRL